MTEHDRSRALFDAAKRGLAGRFDPERGLIRQETEVGAFHPTRESMKYARCLLHDAAPGDGDRALAAAIIERVLAVQERQPGNIHEGNFPWMAGDGFVADLNAVEFILEQLCLILLESSARLSPDLVAAIHAAMRLGLAEIARLDVDVSYTNICLLDCHNSILGGQLLGAEGWVERGRRKLARWASYTAASGAPREYNSPTYAGVDLTALAAIAEHAADPAARLQALLLEERLWLHAALHYHAPTAQIAGPHSRAYQNDVTGGRGSLKTVLYKVLGDERLLRKTPFYPLRQGDGNVDVALTTYHCPNAIRDLLTGERPAYTVREVADAAAGLDLSATLTPDWALGVASRSYGPQADNLILHYRKVAEPRFGVVYARFILNDRRLGGAYHATDRTHSNNISDVGVFRGLQHRNKALGVYGLAPQHEDVSGVKLDVFIPGRQGLGRILVVGAEATAPPADVPAGNWVVLEDGEVYIGLRSLRHSNLGRRAPVRLEADGDDLVLSTVIYEGPPKRFWEYAALAGPFYKGNIECGLIVEVASRGEFPTAEAFAAHLAAAIVDDATVDGARLVRYRSGGDDLLLRYRLRDLEPIERRINGEAFAPEPLAAPWAAQRDGGELSVGGHRLESAIGHAGDWLYTDPTGRVVTATRSLDAPGPFLLRLATGQAIEIPRFGLGRVRCAPAAGTVAVDAAASPAAVELRGWPARPTLRWNGADRSEQLRADGDGVWRLEGDLA